MKTTRPFRNKLLESQADIKKALLVLYKSTGKANVASATQDE